MNLTPSPSPDRGTVSQFTFGVNANIFQRFQPSPPAPLPRCGRGESRQPSLLSACGEGGKGGEVLGSPHPLPLSHAVGEGSRARLSPSLLAERGKVGEVFGSPHPQPLSHAVGEGSRASLPPSLLAERGARGVRFFRDSSPSAQNDERGQEAKQTRPPYSSTIRMCSSRSCSSLTGDGAPNITSTIAVFLGNAITFRMFSSSHTSITSRSMPGAIPP